MLQPGLSPEGQERPHLTEVPDIAPWHDIQAEVIDEANSLNEAGIPVIFTPTIDPYAFPADKQAAADATVARLEGQARIRLANGRSTDDLLPTGRPAFSVWGQHTGTALTLHNIYYPEIGRLGDGIDEAAFSVPLIEVIDPLTKTPRIKSAYEIMEDRMMVKGKPYAEYIAARTNLIDFLITPIDEASREIWQGSRDGVGVRTRGRAAMEYAAAHCLGPAYDGQPIHVTSVACGASTPVYDLMQELHRKGGNIGNVSLVDRDELALSASYYLGLQRKFEGLDRPFTDKINLFRGNLVSSGGAIDLTTMIEPKSQQVIDMLGLFEYLPDRVASSLLERAGEIASDENGLIVFGNMLKDRPQSVFFDHVSLWPKLVRRTMSDVIELVRKAGFDPETQLKIILPPQGVYAIYVIEMNPRPEPADAKVISLGNLAANAV